MAQIIKPFAERVQFRQQPKLWPTVEPAKPSPGKEWKRRLHSSDVMYNGFTGVERMASIGPQGTAKKAGNPPEPTVCSVTGFSDPSQPRRRGYIFTHLEDYRPEAQLDWLPCSRKVHAALHKRFSNPRAWYRIVYKHYRHGAWFTLLTMNPESRFVPYDYLYPEGLPLVDEVSVYLADKMGICKELFNPENDPLLGLWMPHDGIRKIEQ